MLFRAILNYYRYNELHVPGDSKYANNILTILNQESKISKRAIYLSVIRYD